MKYSAYITHHGETYTASYNEKRGVVESLQIVHLSELKEELKRWGKPLVTAIQSVQEFSSDQFQLSCDDELSLWSEENAGSSFEGVVGDSHAMKALVEKSQDSLPKTYRLVYCLEGRVKMVLVSDGEIISQLHMAESELNWGAASLLSRADEWYRRNNISVTSVKDLFLGTREYHDIDGMEPIFSDIDAPYLVAAGAGLVSPDLFLRHSSPLNRTVRSFRTILTAAAVTLLGATLFLTGFFGFQKQQISDTLNKSTLTLELSESEQALHDSLTEEIVRRALISKRMSNTYRWSDILRDFSEITHKGIALNRLGSRMNDKDVLLLAFDGIGQSEEAVSNYIESLKASERFYEVQLTAMDREKNGKQRFRVQCSVK